MNSIKRTRLYLVAGLITVLLMFILPAGYVFAEILQSPGERWQATYQQKDLPASVSEIGRGLHYVQDHTSGELYDIFPMRASIFQVSEAHFLILNNELNPGDLLSIDLVSLDKNGNILRVLSHQEVTSETINPGSWQMVDLPVIELLSPENYLAFHVYSNVSGVNHKIAYEILVHNLVTEFYSYLPLIFR